MTARPRNSFARRRLCALAALLAASVMLLGCGDMAARIAIKHQRNWNRTTVTIDDMTKYTVSDEVIKAAGFKGPASAEGVEVFYTEGRRQLAGELAREMSAVLAATSERIGLKWNHQLRVYAFPVDAVPQCLESEIAAEGAVLSFPFFVRRDVQTLADAVRDNTAWIWYVTHEMTESTLVVGGDGPEVLADAGWGPFTVSFGTRWFREGLSEYAALTAFAFLSERALVDPAVPGAMADFARLDRRGAGLFRWSYHRGGAGDLRADYDAALALFLLIADRFGPDAVPRMVSALSELDYADGKAVISVVDKTLGTDIVRLVRDVKWPYVGATAFVESGGRTTLVQVTQGAPAAKAGLRVGDVVLSIDGREASGLAALQLALVAAADKGVTALRIDRGGEVLEVMVDLTTPAPKPPKGAARAPGDTLVTSEGSVEVRHWKKRGGGRRDVSR